MGTSYGVPVEYKCFSDCTQTGCPGHKVTMNYHRTSDIIIFEFEDGERMCFDPNQWNAMKKAQELSDKKNH